MKWVPILEQSCLFPFSSLCVSCPITHCTCTLQWIMWIAELLERWVLMWFPMPCYMRIHHSNAVFMWVIVICVHCVQLHDKATELLHTCMECSHIQCRGTQISHTAFPFSCYKCICCTCSSTHIIYKPSLTLMRYKTMLRGVSGVQAQFNPACLPDPHAVVHHSPSFTILCVRSPLLPLLCPPWTSALTQGVHPNWALSTQAG